MELTNAFPGGNIEITGKENQTYFVRPELRDTQTDWFYWAFSVSGAQGQTLTFQFPGTYVGYYGPAISHDFKTWRWLGPQTEYDTFTYTFGGQETKVFFAHDLLYQPQRFYDFARAQNLELEPFCISDQGKVVPWVQTGQGDAVILLAARHHCCESTGSYVLEGVLEELAQRPIPGYRVAAVPFVDFDGVLAGDQGKERAPHDHNRDYGDTTLYNTVRRIKELGAEQPVAYALDFHSPWHFGFLHDHVHIVRSSDSREPHLRRFGALLEQAVTPASLKYETKNDLPYGQDWNQKRDEILTFADYFNQFPHTQLAFTLETAYFGLPDNQVTQENLVELGRCFAGALRSYIEG